MHTTALFQAALGLTAPWKVGRVELDAEPVDMSQVTELVVVAQVPGNPETFQTMIYLIAGNLRFDLPRAH